MRIINRYASQDLTGDAMDFDFDFGNSVKLLTVYVRLTSPLIEEVTITFKPAHGSEYNTIIAHRLLDTESCYVFEAEGAIAINEEDRLNVSVTNAQSTGAVYVTVKAESDY